MSRITVREAIRKGEQEVLVLPALIIWVSAVSLIVVHAYDLVPMWTSLALFMVACLGALYVQSLLVYRWKLWAFQNVDSRIALLKRAREILIVNPLVESLFPPCKEIASQLNAISVIDEPPPEPPTNEIAETMEVHYNCLLLYGKTVFWGTALFAAAWIVIEVLKEDSSLLMQIFFTLLLLMCLWFTIEKINRLREHTPPLVFSPKGVKLRRRFFEWNDVKDVTVWAHRQARGISISLHNLPIGWMDDISDLDIDFEHLNKIVSTFKSRWLT